MLGTIPTAFPVEVSVGQVKIPVVVLVYHQLLHMLNHLANGSLVLGNAFLLMVSVSMHINGYIDVHILF